MTGRNSLVVQGNAEVSSVLRAVGVRVADQACLPVVMVECVGDGDVIRSMGDLEHELVWHVQIQRRSAARQ
jgi:hypothetical protein